MASFGVVVELGELRDGGEDGKAFSNAQVGVRTAA